MIVWILNALLAGLALGLILANHIEQGAMQLVVKRATYYVPGGTERVVGLSLRTGRAFA